MRPGVKLDPWLLPLLLLLVEQLPAGSNPLREFAAWVCVPSSWGGHRWLLQCNVKPDPLGCARRAHSRPPAPQHLWSDGLSLHKEEHPPPKKNKHKDHLVGTETRTWEVSVLLQCSRISPA